MKDKLMVREDFLLIEQCEESGNLFAQRFNS